MHNLRSCLCRRFIDQKKGAELQFKSSILLGWANDLSAGEAREVHLEENEQATRRLLTLTLENDQCVMWHTRQGVHFQL